MAIPEENTEHYSEIVISKSVSIGDFLRGGAFAQMGLDPNTPVVLNQAQRHSAWEMTQVRDLSNTLFNGLLYNPKVRERALAATKPGGGALYDPRNPEALPPYLNTVEVWCADAPSKNRKGGASARPIEILDGQQRSFSLRAMTVWMLAKKANLTGELDPTLLDVLMRPEGKKWTPRVQFDLGENAAGTWDNGDGQQGGALSHLLAPLAAGTRADPKTVATQIQSRLVRDLKPAADRSTQATLILRVFKQMDDVWRQLEKDAPEATPETRIDALALCMLRAGLTVSLPSPHMNPELRVHNHNTTGLHFNETETIRSYLVETARQDPSVAAATHKLEADALALGKKSNAHEIERLSYAVAMALASDDLSSLSMKGSGVGATIKDRLAALLHKTPDPQAMAKTIAQHLPAALNAVCLAKVGRLPPAIKSKLPEDVQTLLVNYASLSARGMVPIAAWMAITAPEQARKILPFVNQSTAQNRAAALLPRLKAADNAPFARYAITDALDGFSATWTQRVENAKTGKSMGAQVLFEVLTEGKKPYARTNPEDLVELFRCLSDPKLIKKFSETEVNKKNHELDAGTAAVFRTLLDLSADDIAAGVELVNNKQTFCILPGRPLKNKLEAPNALKIDISTTGVKRLNKTIKDAMASFGGVTLLAKNETCSQKLDKEKRLAARQEDIRHLVDAVTTSWKNKGADITIAKEAEVKRIQNMAKQLAMGILSTPQWKTVVAHHGLVEKVYKAGAHTLLEAEQKNALKALCAGFRAREGKLQPIASFSDSAAGYRARQSKGAADAEGAKPKPKKVKE